MTSGERERLNWLRNYPTVVKLAAMRLTLSDQATFGLTPRMRQTIEAIGYLTEENNISPTVEKIGRRFGLVSKSGVHRPLSALAERLLVTCLPNEARDQDHRANLRPAYREDAPGLPTTAGVA